MSGYDISDKPEDSLDLGPDDRDEDQPNNAPVLLAEDDEDECPICHRETCECPPDESREAWRWPQDA